MHGCWGCHQRRPLESVVVWRTLRHGQWQSHHFAAERVLRVAPEAATWLGSFTLKRTYPLEIDLPNKKVHLKNQGGVPLVPQEKRYLRKDDVFILRWQLL